ncbi:transcriptional regulator [Vibrio xiamenensis]|uniref:Transcriptional regulator n=1 Tax=Vibrio xiamenensis TaxID=861298 RepID=A0A1G8GS80_9VIBR|nr:LysR family transcriptional regulator [Vibrio xiamenensis]SDH97242.1 transcriptional regulator [Vibrio xiamenensis]
MDLNLVSTFLIVAEYQSYTKAAQHMGLTQPAVSSAIKRLEEVIGKSLFVKKGRGIELTPHAFQLMGQFRHGIESIENAIHNIERFHIACSEPLLHIIQPIDQVSFQESPPDKSGLFEELRQQRIDLAIDTILVKDASFVIEEVFREPAVVICRQDHPRIQGTLTKTQFYKEKHCLFIGRWNNLTGVEQIAREPINERKVDLVTASNASMALHISKRDSIAIVSSSFAHQWASALRLQVIDCPLKLDPIPYYFIYHRRSLNNPKHTQLRRTIKAQLEVKT